MNPENPVSSSQVPHKDVVAFVLVGVDALGVRRVLLDCDTRSLRPFRFVGGKQEPSDFDAMAAVTREINEEVGEGTVPRVCTVRGEPLDVVEAERISGSSLKLTSYRIRIFIPASVNAGESLAYTGDCGGRLFWVSLETFAKLRERAGGLFFSDTITERVIEYLGNTKTVYSISEGEMRFCV